MVDLDRLDLVLAGLKARGILNETTENKQEL